MLGASGHCSNDRSTFGAAAADLLDAAVAGWLTAMERVPDGGGVISAGGRS